MNGLLRARGAVFRHSGLCNARTGNDGAKYLEFADSEYGHNELVCT